VLGVKMAGPAIRAWEMAKVLHKSCEVRLVSTEACTLTETPFPVAVVSDQEMKKQVSWCEIIIFLGHTLEIFPWILKSDVIIVADIYDPMHLEYLEQGKDTTPQIRTEQSQHVVDVLNLQLKAADYLICASEKQRDFWLGQLAAVSRLNPRNYDRDPSLRALIDVASFGISNTPAIQTRHAIKGVVPGIEADDQVILWGGGIYNWFDPLTLIRAVALLVETHPKLRLYFLGVKHPNPGVPAMRIASEALSLSDSLGLTNRQVFFNTGWVDYDDRANYLLDADIGVSIHFEHIETAFSFRTRVLDYFWAGLPVVSTEGDTLAELINNYDLGLTVPPGDELALAQAIDTLLDDSARAGVSARVRAFGETMTWTQTLAALTRFCLNPYRAADFLGRSHRQRLTPRQLSGRYLRSWLYRFARRCVPPAVRRFLRRLLSRR